MWRMKIALQVHALYYGISWSRSFRRKSGRAANPPSQPKISVRMKTTSATVSGPPSRYVCRAGQNSSRASSQYSPRRISKIQDYPGRVVETICWALPLDTNNWILESEVDASFETAAESRVRERGPGEENPRDPAPPRRQLRKARAWA